MAFETVEQMLDITLFSILRENTLCQHFYFFSVVENAKKAKNNIICSTPTFFPCCRICFPQLTG